MKKKYAMPTSAITGKGRTTVPKAVRDALDLHVGDQLRWEIASTGIAITKRPTLYRWKGVIKHGPADVVQAVIEARKTRGRI
jgi:bifunctional DNA-binding transcriptional regulator/antitoxin component of YhaV-PrlF toxin-antitoxin module